MSNQMTAAQLKSELRKPGKVFGFVLLTKDDGFYIALEKGSVINAVTDDTVTYNAERREDGLYLN